MLGDVGGLDRVHAEAETVARGVLDSLVEGCQVIGFDWTYLYVNPAVVTQAKRSAGELLGRPMNECYPGIERTEMFQVLRRCMAQRRNESMVNEFSYPNGDKGWFELRFVPVPEGVCILSLDITESKRAQEALKQRETELHETQKFEAVGRLASGVAHDFNNLLSVILSYTSIMLESPDAETLQRADIKEIQSAGQRAADLTRQLLAFARQQLLAPHVLDLNRVMIEMARMLRQVVGTKVELHVLHGASLGRVRVDPGQVERVILNLVVNARDAMPAGGRLTLETQNVILDEEYARGHAGVSPGAYVMLAVTDTGTGMDAAMQKRIFEPFFTTKEHGKGTGLGLATVFGIVKQSHGHIWVYSEPNRGTSFKIYLPHIDLALSESRAPAPSETESLQGNGETILVCEDDDQLRGLLRTILERHGYDVLEARDAVDAETVSLGHAGHIDLLLTDFVLPRIDGNELAEKLFSSRRGMKTLFMSGFTETSLVENGELESGVAYLAKPILPDALLRKVREVISAQGPRMIG